MITEGGNIQKNGIKIGDHRRQIVKKIAFKVGDHKRSKYLKESLNCQYQHMHNFVTG